MDLLTRVYYLLALSGACALAVSGSRTWLTTRDPEGIVYGVSAAGVLAVAVLVGSVA